MNQRLLRFFVSSLLFLIVGNVAAAARSAEPQVSILSPKDGSKITQDQNSIFVSGKVVREMGRSTNVDIMRSSTSPAAPRCTRHGSGRRQPIARQRRILRVSHAADQHRRMSIGRPPIRNLRNSVLAAEVAAARRLLLQLNSEATRVGVLTFSEGARLLQPLTHDFAQVRRAFDDIMRAGPYGGTNMVEGIRMGITELMGLGTSDKRPDAVKVEFLLTDGFPSLPIGGGKRAAPEDTNLAINSARLAGKAGIKVHVFALGEEALTYPRAAVGIAKESGGTYTPVTRPADVLAVVENISVVGVDYVQVVNQTTGQKATQMRLAADGFFSSAVPVVEGRNQIDVYARATYCATVRDSYVFTNRSAESLDLKFSGKRAKAQVNRAPSRSPSEIQRAVQRNRRCLNRAQLPPRRKAAAVK